MIQSRFSDFQKQVLILPYWEFDNGLDAHRDDYLAGMNLTNHFYIEATKILKSYNVPLIFILEGGYNPEVVKNVSFDIIKELDT